MRRKKNGAKKAVDELRHELASFSLTAGFSQKTAFQRLHNTPYAIVHCSIKKLPWYDPQPELTEPASHQAKQSELD
jgi:hypothetical protein